jgi:hypothetical protein
MSSSVIPIVFIHIGGAPPEYLRIAVRQARQWNPSAPLSIITSELPGEPYNAKENWVTIDTIPSTHEHTIDTERLVVLHDWMVATGITECLYLDTHTMLYRDISEILPTLQAAGTLVAPAHGAGTVSFSIVYCRGPLTKSAYSFLPGVPPSAELHPTAIRARYVNPAFPCVFDAATYGQYLDAENPGLVNHAEFRADQFAYTWRKDAAERLYPLLIDKDGREWPIANLRIQSKALDKFI